MKDSCKALDTSVKTGSMLSVVRLDVDQENEEDFSNNNRKRKTSEPFEEEYPAPDGGYGWVIVFASFMCNFIVDGIAYTFGIIFEHLVDHFESSKGQVALVGSLLTGCYLVAGPMVGALTNKFGCRPVTIFGSLISCMGFMLSIIAPNINVLLITYGVMGGIGFGLIYLPAIVNVGYYFSTKRAFATGISVCGSGVGAFILAPFCQYLLRFYDWEGVVVIFAGIALNGAVFGALMRPLVYDTGSEAENLLETSNDEVQEGETSVLLSRNNQTLSKTNLEPGVQSVANLTEMMPPTPVLLKLNNRTIKTTDSLSSQNLADNQDITQLNKLRSCSVLISYSDYQDQLKTQNGYCSESLTPQGSKRTLQSRRSSAAKSQTNVLRPLSRVDIFYSGSRTNINGHLSRGTSKPSVLTSSKIDIENLKREPSKAICQLKSESSFWMKLKKCVKWKPKDERLNTCEECLSLEILHQMVDFSILKESIGFRWLAASNVFGFIAFYIPFMYITQHAQRSVKDDGVTLSPEKAAVLLSCIGITNIAGRLFLGWINDKISADDPSGGPPGFWAKYSALIINNLCLAVAGLCMLVIPFITSYESLMILCAVFGLCGAGYMCLTSIVLVNLVGLDKLTNAFGLVCLCRGVASMLGPPAAGLIFDATGSFVAAFNMAGALFLTSSATSFAVMLCKESKLKS